MLVVKLKDCIARPPEDSRIYPLTEHLSGVARKSGQLNDKPADKILFLAGLMHDAGKMRYSWQMYIRGKGPSTPHSPLGAALFLFFIRKLIESWSVPDNVKLGLNDFAFRIALIISAHHGLLKELDELVPWVPEEVEKALREIDWESLKYFVNDYFPELNIETQEHFIAWLKKSENIWGRWGMIYGGRVSRLLEKSSDRFETSARMVLKLPESRLIFADRSHAGDIKEVYIQSKVAQRALHHLEKICKIKARTAISSGANKQLVEERQRIQYEAEQNYSKNDNERIFSLLLPTGYGKTLTALKIGLSACAAGRCKRIIYVAPYLSILSQATQEIKEATGISPLQHHHLSALGMDDETFRILESWQSEIVTTTFNQLFSALFPKTSNQTMRLEALREAFLIVDEPQIVNKEVWCVFLKMLEAITHEMQTHILLTTATFPPWQSILHAAPVNLVEIAKTIDRYEIVWKEEDLDEKSLAKLCLKRIEKTGSMAIVLNTVKDAVMVYNSVKEKVGRDINVYILTGRMLSPHKAARIEKIATALSEKKRMLVICTQILEAGVDLSFREIFRAKPIFTSIVQTAGRVNRHGEDSLARAIVFPFKRNGTIDTRYFVYKDKIALEQTDQLLAENTQWLEKDSGRFISEFYRRCWEQNRGTTFMDRLANAAMGNWSALAGLEPFGEENYSDPVFVPIDNFIKDPNLKQLMKRFGISGSEELFEKYSDNDFRKVLDWVDKKKFMALMQSFIVNLPKNIIPIYADRVDERNIYRLSNIDDYHEDTGLAHLKRQNQLSVKIL